MLLIGFGYRARQGKNTAAFAARESAPLDADIRCYAFADALKSEVRKACAIVGGQYALIQSFQESELMPSWVRFEEPKPRTLLQWWGSWKREKDPFYWIGLVDKAIDKDNPETALITDLRHPNEADYIKGRGGYLVQVVNTGATDVDVNDHESEHALDGYRGWDYTLEAASVAECKRKAVEIFAEIQRRHGLL